ncbi:MAG TPA: tetratricopeptide repeat protein [Myxococcales bacterium]|jgi:tetratricopeptide (TPR) repeat protein
MYNLLISLGVALALLAGVLAAGFSPWAAPIPAILGLLLSNFLLTRRMMKKVQALAERAQKELTAAQGTMDPKQQKVRFDKAIETLKEGFQYDKWQFLVAAELHSQIGLLEYVRKDFDAAKPHLEKASTRGPVGARAKAMLGCLAFKAKDESAMRAAFEQAVKAGKKEPIVWAAYAWCLDKLEKRDDALKVLARGVEANPADDKLKASMVALQNEKKFKMKAYGMEWYQFHLENPPMDMGPGGGRRVSFQRR